MVAPAVIIAICTTVGGCALTTAVGYLVPVAVVRRSCGYLILPNRNVPQLKDKLEELKHERERKQRDIEEAGNNMQSIHTDVTTWTTEVDFITKEAGPFLQQLDGRANETCFGGWLPNPKGRYHLGKEASRMVEKITKLIERGKGFKNVGFEKPPPGRVTDPLSVNSLADDGDDVVPEQIPRGPLEKVDLQNPPPGLVGGAPDVNSSTSAGRDIITDSRASILKRIMNALKDEKVKVIGIYGLSGVGKTWLLKKVRDKGRPFDMIVKAEVLKAKDVNEIQHQIADALSLNLKGKQSQLGRSDLLRQRLQKVQNEKDRNEKILIMLDDLWEKLDLEAVGIPSGDESSKCKLLLTSRNRNVLTQMGCAPPNIFHLERLNDDEAFRLFKEKVGDRLEDDEDVSTIAPLVVKKLAGLPLLINSVAATLKDNDLSAWKYASRNLDVTQMKTIVELSYDNLESEDAKTLFRVCGLIGGSIGVEYLLGLGMGLGLFEEFNSTIEDARDKLNIMVTSLRSVCLLEDGGNDEGEVTIHDLYSEVVVSTRLGAQDSLVMNNSSWLEQKLEKCWGIRLADVSRDRLDKLMTCQFSELEILILSQPGDWRWKSERHDDARDCCEPLHFKNMKGLRVLCLRSMPIAPLPPWIEIRESLRSLYLDYCHVDDVAILGGLEALEILSFEGSTISTLPKEIGGLKKLRSLNLSECSRLEIIERGALKGLLNLEELYMNRSFDGWMDDDKEPSESCNARLAELKSLTKLTALEISIPDPTVLLEDGDLPFGNLIRFWINIGHADEVYSENSRTMMLNLGGCDSVLSKEVVQKFLQETQHLLLEGLREYKESAHELCIRGFSQLKHLVIKNCSSIKYIASSSNGHQPLSAFSSLESLHLENLDSLEKICHGLVDEECLGKLKIMTVIECHHLKNLRCPTDKQKLVHLERISVGRCDSMQAIITYDATDVEAATDDIIELPNVRHLELWRLPNMTSFCIGDNSAPIQISFPCLESLTLEGLDKICHWPHWPDWFGKLKSLSVQHCPNLKSLRYHSNMQGLVHLENIEVGRCDSMQAIITYDATNVEAAADGIVELPNVRHLELRRLPKMTSFCIGDNGAPIQISLPCLEALTMEGLDKICHWPEWFGKLKSLRVQHCPNLKSLRYHSDMQGLVHLENIEVGGCDSMQAIITYDGTNVEAAANGIVELPNMRHLELRRLPKMTSFCIKENGAPIQVSFPCLESLTMEEMDKICHVPECFNKLKALRLLQCPHLKSLQYHSNMQGIVHLEKIVLGECDSMQAIITYTTNVEVAIDDIVELPNVHHLELQRLPNMTSFCIRDNGEPIQISFPNLESLTMEELDKICHVPECFNKLKALRVLQCPLLKSLQCHSDMQGLVHLEKIVIGGCDSMQAIITYDATNIEVVDDGVFELTNVRHLELWNFPNMTSFCIDADGAPIQVSFPHLESLKISRLPKLEKICHGPDESKCFSKLQDVNVAFCDRLGHLFCLSNKQRLVHLEKIEIQGCGSLRAIITYDARNIEVAVDGIVELPNVHQLKLDGLPKMRSFCIRNDYEPIQLSLPCLEKLELQSLGCLERDWHRGLSESSFYRLASLYLFGCPHIVDVFPSTIIALPNLEELSVNYCSSLKSLVEWGSLNSNIKQVMSFPSLRSLSIQYCPNVGAFIRSPTNVGWALGEKIEEYDESAQPLFNEMVTFPNIRKLKIEDIGCEELWNNKTPHDSFCKLETLYLKYCDKLRHIAPSCMWKKLRCCLEILEVISCRSIEVIYEGDETDTESGKLRNLVMRDLDNLKHIWRSDGQPNVPFSNLRKVGAVRCSSLKILFPSFTEKFLEQIEELVVESCEDMKLIAGHEESEQAISRTIIFSQLSALGLLELPQFKSLPHEKYSPNFPSLKVENRKSCGNEPDQHLGDWERYKRERTCPYGSEEEFLLWEPK